MRLRRIDGGDEGKLAEQEVGLMPMHHGSSQHREVLLRDEGGAHQPYSDSH
jgi:hypothetical protein